MRLVSLPGAARHWTTVYKAVYMREIFAAM